jgi:hypothetical protein
LKTFFSSLFCLLVLASCAPLRVDNSDLAGSKPGKLVERDRMDAIRNADVWIDGSLEKISSRDLRSGPKHDLFNKPGQEIVCDFVEPDKGNLPGGQTPKFDCELPYKGKMKKFKVKYDPYFNKINGKGAVRNLEVYGEILSTRLMWALGFPADSMYTVKVVCRNCPLDPWLYIRKELGIYNIQDTVIGFVDKELERSQKWKEGRGDRVFDPAIVEVKFSGDTIALEKVKGWEWSELFDNMANPEVQKPQREALAILMAFIQHMDSKAEQQRLTCEKDSWDGYNCTKPYMVVQDAGSNFGNGWAPFQGDILLNKVTVGKWVKLPLWRDKDKCILKINAPPNASLKDSWQVSEEGRAFLANLMKELTAKQIRDLFTVSRISMSGEQVTITEWVNAFMEKMDREILSVKCKK